MTTIIIIVGSALISFAVELALLDIGASNRIIDAVGRFWVNVAMILIVVMASPSFFNLASGILGVLLGGFFGVWAHLWRAERSAPLQFFTRLNGRRWPGDMI